MGRPKKNQSATVSVTSKKVFALDGLSDISAETDTLWSATLKRLNKLSRVYGFERFEPALMEDSRLYELFYKTHPKLLQRAVKVPPSKV